MYLPMHGKAPHASLCTVPSLNPCRAIPRGIVHLLTLDPEHSLCARMPVMARLLALIFIAMAGFGPAQEQAPPADGDAVTTTSIAIEGSQQPTLATDDDTTATAAQGKRGRLVGEAETAGEAAACEPVPSTRHLLMVLAGLLTLSFFFSGSETALFSLNRIQLTRIEREERPTASERAILTLMSNGRSTLTTILLGNLMVNVATSLVVGTIVQRSLGHHVVLSFLVGTLLATVALLIIGEITPKTLAIEHSERYARVVAPPLLLLRTLLTPIRALFDFASERLFRLLGMPAMSDTEAVSEQELKGLVTIGHIAGIIQDEQREMIDSVFDFTESTVDQIMTPRVGLTAYPINIDSGELRQHLTRGEHSRVLIYRDNIDHVVGVLHTKDALLNPEKDFRSLMRRPLFVPEKKRLDNLLNDFRRRKQHLAVVVDEYGGTAGCVTLNDLIEEIFGGVVEVSAPGDLTLQKIDDHTYEVDGLYRIGDLNYDLDLDLPEDEGTTVSGFISNRLGDFPKPRTRLRVGNVQFTVLKMAARRVAIARMNILQPAETPEGAVARIGDDSSGSRSEAPSVK